MAKKELLDKTIDPNLLYLEEAQAKASAAQRKAPSKKTKDFLPVPHRGGGDGLLHPESFFR